LSDIPRVLVGIAQPPSSWRMVSSHRMVFSTCAVRWYPARMSSSVTAAE